MASPHRDPRTGIYYFRRIIPEDLRPFLDGKREIKVSLGTRDPDEARALFPNQAAECERRFQFAHRQLRADQQQQAGTMVDRWIDTIDTCLDRDRWLTLVQYELALREAASHYVSARHGSHVAASAGDFGEPVSAQAAEGLMPRVTVLGGNELTWSIPGRESAARLLASGCLDPIHDRIIGIAALNDVAVVRAEAQVKPDDVLDDSGWEAMAGVGDRRHGHRHSRSVRPAANLL